MSQVWQVVASQLSYAWKPVTFASLLFTTLLLVFIVSGGENPGVERAALLVLSAAGLLVHVANWFIDLKERRPLMLLSLPLSRWRAAFGYFLVPLVTQLILTVSVALPMFWLYFQRGELAGLPDFGARLLSVGGALLGIMYLSYFFCEVLIRVSMSKTLVYSANGLLILLIFSGAFGLFEFGDMLLGVYDPLWVWAFCLFFFLATVISFVRRQNHTMGIHPVYGTPQDWSSPASSEC